MAKIITSLGYVLLCAGAAVLALGLVSQIFVATTDSEFWGGIANLHASLGPFSIVYFYFEAIVILAPGLLLLYWGTMLRERRK